MRLKLFILLAVAALAGPLVAHATTPSVEAPTLPTSAQDHSVDPIVLTGNQFPAWSAGPELVAQAPGSPANSSTAGQEGNVPVGHSACYAPGSKAYDPGGYGCHSCDQGSLMPRANNKAGDATNGVLNTNIGPKVNRLVGYRWDPSSSKFVQFPLQVDEKFTRFISNNASDFAFYSGVDQETNYAFDREGFRYSSDQFLQNGGTPSDLNDRGRPRPGAPCLAEPANGSPALNAKGYSAQADPIRGLDDNDEVAFMWRDAGAEAAPTGAALPAGVTGSYRVAVADPSNPSVVRY